MPATVESKLVSWLSPDPNQPRKAFDDAYLRVLGVSLLKKQWYALLIRPTGVILDGECRWRAAKLVGMDLLDVIVVHDSLSRSEATELQLVTALHRAALSPFEQACGFRDWLTGSGGKTTRELAGRVDRDPSLITRYVSIFDCIQRVQDAAANNKIGPSQWYPISQLPHDDQNELLEVHLIGIPRDQLAAACRKRRTAAIPKTGVTLHRVKCPLSSGTTVVVSGPKMNLEAYINSLQAALDAAKRANKESLDIRTAEKVWRDRSKVEN